MKTHEIVSNLMLFLINNKLESWVSVKVQDENSISRQRKASALPKSTKKDILAVLGNSEESKYPIYMTGN